MVYLFNDCYRSEISVQPKNWNTDPKKTTQRLRRELMSKPWRIFYRYYDPRFKDDPLNWGKMIAIRGMNKYGTLEKRQIITKALINQEKDLLDVQGWNPIAGQWMVRPENEVHEINPGTPFITALRLGLDKLDLVTGTYNDINSIINSLEDASGKLFDTKICAYYNQMAVSEIGMRHIKRMFELIAKNNPKFSNNRFNKYKAYLSMIYKELIEAEAVDSNPTRDISSKKKTRKLRAILTPEEEKKINDYLHDKDYRFWRFMRLFYDCQARTTEMMQLRKDDRVRIDQQEITVTVKKGSETKEAVRIISKDVIHLWQEVWDEAKAGQYLFSKGLKPSTKPIRPDQIGRRWNRYVKINLGINKDFYSLKHLSTDKMSASYGLKVASFGAGHTNLQTTRNHYAVGEKQRELELLKQKKINFGG